MNQASNDAFIDYGKLYNDICDITHTQYQDIGKVVHTKYDDIGNITQNMYEDICICNTIQVTIFSSIDWLRMLI